VPYIKRAERVLLFLDEPNPISGAPWTRIKSFAKAFLTKKHEVDVIGVFTPTSLQKRGIKKTNGINAINLTLKIPLINPSIFMLNAATSFFSSMAILAVRRPKVAVVSFPGGDSGTGFIIACSILRIRYVVDYRDEWENQIICSSKLSQFSKSCYRLIKKMAVFLYKRAAFVSVVTTPFVVDLNKMGVTNVLHIPNGAVCSAFKPVERKSDNGFFSIVYSGGVGEYYRLDIVLSAIGILVGRNIRNIRLLIVGRGTNERILYNLRAYAQQLGIQQSFIYLGNKSNVAELSKIIAEADAGIIPYDDSPLWKNALPAKFYEYCSSGLPVIATTYDDSILGKLIRKNDIGLTSNPLDDKGLADIIEEIYWNKEYRVTAGRRARVLIEEHFDRTNLSALFAEKVCEAGKCQR
jgi:glycosyltransferase involved in cell wall biosynthesis